MLFDQATVVVRICRIEHRHGKAARASSRLKVYAQAQYAHLRLSSPPTRRW